MEKKSCNLGTRKQRHASGPRNLKEFGVSGMKACSGAHFGVFFAEIKGKMGGYIENKVCCAHSECFSENNRTVDCLWKFLQNESDC